MENENYEMRALNTYELFRAIEMWFIFRYGLYRVRRRVENGEASPEEMNPIIQTYESRLGELKQIIEKGAVSSVW